jgi:hypothetical protein
MIFISLYNHFYIPCQARYSEQPYPFFLHSRHGSCSNYRPAPAQVPGTSNSGTAIHSFSLSCIADLFFSRSVAIRETCSEFSVGLESVPSPSLRTAPRRDSAFAHPMTKVKLGSKEFNVDCEEIMADKCGVSDEECAAFGELIRSGKINRVKKLSLVRNNFRLRCLWIVCCVVGTCET